jgi:hypothetical protein
MEDYEEIFRVQNNNCKEVLFAIQFVPQVDTWGLGNSISLAYDRELTNGFDANGQWTFASHDIGRLMLDQREEAGDAEAYSWIMRRMIISERIQPLILGQWDTLVGKKMVTGQNKQSFRLKNM